MTLIDGKAIAQDIEAEVATFVSSLEGRKPGLAFVLIGQNPASRTYISAKKKACARAGILSFDKEFPETIPQAQLIEEIEKLNQNPKIDAILIQQPLPSHLHVGAVMTSVSIHKDVDGFHPYNVGCLLLGEKGLVPCTPRGIQYLLETSNIPLAGKHVVIVGRSNIVGKPLAALLMQKHPNCNATVTVAHSHTENLKALCLTADIVAATGKPHLITKDMVKKGATVIDVGMNRVEGRIVGDVDFHGVSSVASHITPVPGGVGPMTIAMLLANTLLCYKHQARYKRLLS